MNDISLLCRADLPVIWEEFKTKAAAVRRVAETLTVTCITQKEEMALARKTRLTLREIRVAVEHKRVKLGEGHLKEIQKVNGAARAIREFIEPLEARLLVQEEFAERAEVARIAELAHRRNAELYALSPHARVFDVGAMSQENYNSLMDTLKAEQVEKEAANRLRIEAESRLAAQKLEMELREVAIRAETERQRKETAAILNAKLEAQRKESEAIELKRAEEYKQKRAEDDRRRAAEYEEQKRLNDEAEKVRFEQEAKHRAELAAASAIRTLEREAEEKRLRVEREKTAAAEEKLAAIALDAARVAAVEEKRLRDIEVAPDAEKLIAYVDAVRSVSIPVLHSKEANTIFNKVAYAIAVACGELRSFGN